MTVNPVATVLARAFLAGELDAPSLVRRGELALGRTYRWLEPVARRFAAFCAERTLPRVREAEQFLLGIRDVRRARPKAIPFAHWGQPEMRPAAAAATWDVPAMVTASELAEWLSLTPEELTWFADLTGRASHYHYTFLTKRSGSPRLIEAPKSRLKAIQRRILDSILQRVPVHESAHGFVRGRSILSFARPHVGRRTVLRMDLRDFFPAISGVRVQSFFRTLGYPETVADLLGGLCANAVPRRVWPAMDDVNARWAAASLHARPHLPQGAPTSPALANAMAYHVDCRLAGLAAAADLQYTRYADDLAFSGAETFRALDFAAHVAVILDEEGFAVNHRKTRVMRRGGRQRLAGLVTNERLNVSREEVDRLRATLTNCARRGPAGENRAGHPSFREHLEGRVGFVAGVNPAKGERLRRILERIVWE